MSFIKFLQFSAVFSLYSCFERLKSKLDVLGKFSYFPELEISRNLDSHSSRLLK